MYNIYYTHVIYTIPAVQMYIHLTIYTVLVMRYPIVLPLPELIDFSY